MNHHQKERYNRHIVLPQIGMEGQKKLQAAKVLVVGAGGLGTPILQYLTGAGVGTLGIVDPDKVSLSNLQRQVLYNESQVGQGKASKAKEVLEKLNSEVTINAYEAVFDEKNAEELISSYDVIVGATDNFASRKCIDTYTKKLGKPFVHGSIGEFEGQVTVFNYKGGMAYSDLFPDTPEEEGMPIGVMGVLPGIIGSIQAAETIKIIVGKGQVLAGRILVYDAMEARIEILNFAG